MTRKKGARESTDEPLSKTSGQQKRYRRGSERPVTNTNTNTNTDADKPTMPPPPAPRVSGASPRARDSTLEPATSHLRRRFDLDAALENARLRSPVVISNPPPIPRDEPPIDSGVPTPRPRLPMSCVPRRAMSRTDIMKMPLDHRAGFVLAHIDGETNIRTIVDLCGMPEAEVCAMIERLIALRVIVLK